MILSNIWSTFVTYVYFSKVNNEENVFNSSLHEYESKEKTVSSEQIGPYSTKEDSITTGKPSIDLYATENPVTDIQIIEGKYGIIRRY